LSTTDSHIIRTFIHTVRGCLIRVSVLENELKVFQPLVQPTVSQELAFQFQSTQFTKCNGAGNAKVYATTAPTAIDEETLASVAAYATFDDAGGKEGSAASASTFDATMHRVPLDDNEGRTAYYHGHWKHIAWSPYLHPTVEHKNQFLRSNSVELNVPGTSTIDQKGFVYYDSHANFNISASTSVSLWFYPTDLSQIASETWRHLLYRRIDASNHYAILLKPADKKIYVFINEAGATTKLVTTGTVNANAWNLVIFTYNPSTNALVIYLNNSSASSTPADTYTAPYTTDANMYLGGLPNLPDKRYTGYLDNFVFWTGKILTGTEAGNMWTRGTII
jgi:Concanavalin A-like lectin/glucanases superfamily